MEKEQDMPYASIMAVRRTEIALLVLLDASFPRTHSGSGGIKIENKDTSAKHYLLRGRALPTHAVCA